MNNVKFVAKSSTSKLFIGENGDIISDHNKAKLFDKIGDCFKACIKANDDLGKPAFVICQIFTENC